MDFYLFKQILLYCLNNKEPAKWRFLIQIYERGVNSLYLSVFKVRLCVNKIILPPETPRTLASPCFRSQSCPCGLLALKNATATHYLTLQ